MAFITAPTIAWSTPSVKPQAMSETMSVNTGTSPVGTGFIAAPRYDTVISVPAVGYPTSG